MATLDSWADFKYGEWIWQNRRLPSHEPFSSFSDSKIHPRDGSWLAEVTYYLVVSRTGLEGVALLHALLEAAKAGLFLLAVRRMTGSLGMAIAVTALMEAACWPFFSTIRTSVPAEVCWAGLLLACSGPMPSRAALVAVPILVALWANLSPSFGYAFMLLGGLTLGLFLVQVRAYRRLTAAVRDPGVVRLAVLLGLSLAAAACNPYLTAHLHDSFGPEGLVVLDARQWGRLVPVHVWESRAMIASGVVVLLVLRLSPRRFTPAEVLLTATFAVWAWFDRRVAPFWLMLGLWLLAPHLKALWDAAVARRIEPRWPALGQYLGLGLAALLVLLSPAARWAAGHPWPESQRIGPMEPYDLVAGLPPRGADEPGRRILNLPYWWGDYLLWRLPAGDQVFWYSRPEGFMRPLKNACRRYSPPPPNGTSW